MKTIAWAILVVALACGAGCARPDWIDQTLVTVDVTGTWEGAGSGTAGQGREYVLTLEQQGPKVTGSVQRFGGGMDSSGPIEGTVTGDAFSFRQMNGPLKGEMTVSGDEMTGAAYLFVSLGRGTLTLRRVSSPSRPSAP